MERDCADSKNQPDTGSRKCQGLKRMLKALLFWRRGTSSRTIKVSNEYIENVEIYETINRQPDANKMQTMAGMRHNPLNLENIDYIDLTQSEGKRLLTIELDENEYQNLMSSQSPTDSNPTRIRSAMSSFLSTISSTTDSYEFQYGSSITRVDLCSSIDPENSEIDADSLNSNLEPYCNYENLEEINKEKLEFEATLNSAQNIISNLKSNYKHRNEYIRNYCEDLKKTQTEIFDELLSSLTRCQNKVLDRLSVYEETCKQSYHSNPNYLASLQSYSQSLRELRGQTTANFSGKSAYERGQLQRRAFNLKRGLYREEQLAKKYFLADRAIKLRPQLLEGLRHEIGKLAAGYMGLQRAGPLTASDLTAVDVSKALGDLKPGDRPLDVRTLSTGNILLVYRSWDRFLKALEYNSELSFIQVLTSADRYNGEMQAKHMNNRYVTCTGYRFIEVLDNQLKRLHCKHLKSEPLRLVGLTDQLIYFKSQLTAQIHKYDWRLRHLGCFGQKADPTMPFHVSSKLRQLSYHRGKYYWIDGRSFHVMDAVNGFGVAAYECSAEQLEIEAATARKTVVLAGGGGLVHFDESDECEGGESLAMVAAQAKDLCFFVDTSGQPSFFDVIWWAVSWWM